MNLPSINLLHLINCPIYEQLHLEEALLRGDKRNWCILNSGSPTAIVMGISAKPDQVINYNLIQKAPIPLIRRFTGGGTVIIDHNTCFVTLICNSHEISIPCYPEKVMQWTSKFYSTVFSPYFNYELRENDYVYKEKKFGGNAQYMCKDRWLHHTSHLWDFNETSMDYLLIPPKMPTYRQQRSHSDFLCRLKTFFAEKDHFLNEVKKGLSQHFIIQNKYSYSDVSNILNGSSRKSTAFVQI